MKLAYTFKINWLIKQRTDSAPFLPLDASILRLSCSALISFPKTLKAGYVGKYILLICLRILLCIQVLLKTQIIALHFLKLFFPSYT